MLVEAVVHDSPAAKAGIAQYDILLRAGDKPLAEPRDLMAAVEAAKETKLKIDLIRGGKPKTIEVTPGQAARADRRRTVPGLTKPIGRRLQKWLEGMTPGEQSGLPVGRSTSLRPGAIVPKDVLIPQAVAAEHERRHHARKATSRRRSSSNAATRNGK